MWMKRQNGGNVLIFAGIFNGFPKQRPMSEMNAVKIFDGQMNRLHVSNTDAFCPKKDKERLSLPHKPQGRNKRSNGKKR